jgi:hypothetical protein
VGASEQGVTLGDMVIPGITAIEQAKKEDKLTEVGSTEHDDSGYHLVHVLMPMVAPEAGGGNGLSGLNVPGGYSLVVLEFEGTSSPAASSFKIPVLVDTLNNEYQAAGVAIRGSTDQGEKLEFAYSTYTDKGTVLNGSDQAKIAFPRELELAKKKAQISRGVIFYLIAQKSPAIGLAGIRIRSSATDRAGALIPVGGDVDAVVVAGQ